jgi:hypothetical protein
VLYSGTCGDGEIINGTCYRVCDWVIPPDADVCGGYACDSSRTCLTTRDGLVVAGRCQDCACVAALPPTRTATPTPSGGTPPAGTPRRTVPPSLQRAIDLTCGGHASERQFEAEDGRFSGECSGFEYAFRAAMRQFDTPEAATQALDHFRDRGVAVPFRGGVALTWTDNYENERAVYYVWARGCWLVQVSDEKNLSSGHALSPLRLAEPIYVFATADGLFDQCLHGEEP